MPSFDYSQGMAAEKLFLAWLVSILVNSRILPRIFGREPREGAPLWRSAASIPTQWLVLPASYYVGGAVAERFFVYVFAGYMLVDFVLVKLSTLLVVHHIFCLIGHAIVVLALPVGMPIYWAGVVALEVGSGFFNLYCLFLGAPTLRWARSAGYVLGMTLSNAYACYLCYEWVMLGIPLAPKVLNAAITTIMCALRQKTCYRLVATGKVKSH